MNHLLRTCKCHWIGTENLHWGHTLDRRAFAPPGTPLQFAPDAPVTGTGLRLELHLDLEAERAWGTTTHKLHVHARELSTVRFDAMGLEVSGVKLNGRRVEFENTGEAVLIDLPKPLKRGDTPEVTLTHAVTRPKAGLYFTNPDAAYPRRFQTAWTQGQDEDSRYYFPCLDAPQFKQPTETLIYVPKGLFALSNGELVAHKTGATAGEDLWHYRLQQPYSTYLLSIVAGPFVEHVEKAGDVEVRWAVQAGREAEARNAFGNTPAMVRFFSGYFGVPYPHKRYTQIAVPDFVFGGMENFTATTQTDLTLHDDRAHQDFSSDDLVSHELAHTWFGNLVTARSWAHAWLHESFATYSECLWTREHLGQAEYDYKVLEDAEAYFHEDGQYRRAIVTHRYEAPIDLFDAHLYPGGAVRLRNLHALLGEEAFREALRVYLERHRHGLAETVDLARVVREVTGQNYDWWFDQWILSAGYPSLEIKYAWKEEQKQAELSIQQKQPVTEPGADVKQKRWFRLPVTLGFQMGRALREVPVVLTEEVTTLVIPLSRKPSMVLFDPHHECPVRRVTFEKPQELLLAQLRSAPGAVSRIEAAGALADKPNHTVVEALSRQLRREPFWGVQQRIARALGKIGGQAARDALLRARNLPHPKARRAVVEALGWFREDRQVAATLTRMARQGDASYYVEAALATALGRCRASRARTLLAGFLEKDSHLEVIRSGAYAGFAALADPEDLPTVSEGLRWGAPALSRAAAINAVAELARQHLHLRHEVLDLLGPIAEQRDDPAGSFRGKLAVLRAIEKIGDLDGLGLLNRVAGQEADGRIVRLAKLAATALRTRADKPAELRTLRTDVDSVVRENKSLRERLERLEQSGAARPRRPRRKAGR